MGTIFIYSDCAVLSPFTDGVQQGKVGQAGSANRETGDDDDLFADFDCGGG